MTLGDADTVKIALLAAMIWIATRRHEPPAWFARTSLAFAPVLALSGLAFPLESSALYGVLYVTLPALLLWVATAAWILRRRGFVAAVPAASGA